MVPIIGREKELEIINTAFQSNVAEFIAVYGRRRVGKTYLIRNFFHARTDTLFFYVTGTNNGSMTQQIRNFLAEVAQAFLYPGARLEIADWRDAFQALTENIKKSPHKKIVLFFDEFPWMVTRKSKLMETLEYFWNRHWSMDPRIKLIICGSSSGWILKHIVHNRGGLYNRVTFSIHLKPFDLAQTKKFLRHQNISLQDKDIADIYMVLGGIPYYLSKVKRGLSAAQVIEDLAFQENSFLLEEFNNLFATLFDGKGFHVALARIIAQHSCGIGQEELVKEAEGFSSGGRINSWLKDLEQAGFIHRFTPFGSRRKGIFYKIDDEYSLFYFQWIEPIQNMLIKESMSRGYWEGLHKTSQWKSWAGRAFETICFKHIRVIRRVLKLPPDALAYTWRYIPKKEPQESGAQIDLLFDRSDNVITLCEIKYTQEPYALNKENVAKIKRQIKVFKKQTKTKKNLFIVFISAHGLKKNMYADDLVNGVVTLRDLCKYENDL
jgi:hypothetical protein